MMKMNKGQTDINLAKLQAQADQESILKTLSDWNKSKDSEALKSFIGSFTRIFFYINNLELEKYSFDRIISEFRLSNNRAVQRYRIAEKENKELKSKVEDLEKKLKLFGI